MIHYHGGPITPTEAAIRAWTARHAFISFAHPQQIELAASVCHSFALDNGAFSAWKSNRPMDLDGFYAFVDRWRNCPGFDFAVIPDVIEGTEAENDAMIEAWPFPGIGAPVWHTNEPPERLHRLADQFPRVCIGSSGQYDVSTPAAFLSHVGPIIAGMCDENGYPRTKLHGLRMLNPAIFGRLPLSSADSTSVARNINADKRWAGSYSPRNKATRAELIASHIERTPGALSVMGPTAHQLTMQDLFVI